MPPPRHKLGCGAAKDVPRKSGGSVRHAHGSVEAVYGVPAAHPGAPGWQCPGPASAARTRVHLGGDLQGQAQRGDALGHHAPAPRVLVKDWEQGGAAGTGDGRGGASEGSAAGPCQAPQQAAGRARAWRVRSAGAAARWPPRIGRCATSTPRGRPQQAGALSRQPRRRGAPCARLPPTMSRPAAPSPSFVIHLMAAEVATVAAGPALTPSACAGGGGREAGGRAGSGGVRAHARSSRTALRWLCRAGAGTSRSAGCAPLPPINALPEPCQSKPLGAASPASRCPAPPRPCAPQSWRRWPASGSTTP